MSKYTKDHNLREQNNLPKRGEKVLIDREEMKQEIINFWHPES